MNVWTAIFADKLDVDDREPLATFQIPGIEGSFGIFPPKAGFWIQLTVFFYLQAALQVVYACAVYKFIVQQRGTITAYLLGYGVLMPTVLYIPYYLLELFDVRNKSLKMAMGQVATLVFFRCIEAMHGTAAPPTVETSMRTYVEYYTALTPFDWDPKTATRRKITTKELLQCFWRTLSHFHLVGIVLSVALHYDFKPFPSNVVLDDYHFGLELFTLAHIGNCYLMALLTFLILAMGFEMAGITENTKGYYTKPIFHNPLLMSRSPTEFWSRRWNLTIQHMLKHCIFLPAKQFFPTPVCVVLAFVFSGLLHDYAWTLMFYNYDYMRNADGFCHDEKCYHPVMFKVTMFFAWNAVIVLLEKKIGHLFSFTKSWPTVIVSTLVTMTALPVSHWFMGDWAVGGYFKEFALGVWIIRKVV